MQSGGRNALGGKPRIERRLSHLFSFFVVVFSGKSSRKGRRKGAKNGRTNYLLIKLVRAPQTTDTIHSQSHREPPNNCLLSRRPPLPISLSLSVFFFMLYACRKEALFTDLYPLTQPVACIITHAAVLTHFIVMEASGVAWGFIQPHLSGFDHGVFVFW